MPLYAVNRLETPTDTHTHTMRRERKQTTPYLELIVDTDTSINITSFFHIV